MLKTRRRNVKRRRERDEEAETIVIVEVVVPISVSLDFITKRELDFAIIVQVLFQINLEVKRIERIAREIEATILQSGRDQLELCFLLVYPVPFVKGISDEHFLLEGRILHGDGAAQMRSIEPNILQEDEVLGQNVKEKFVFFLSVGEIIEVGPMDEVVRLILQGENGRISFEFQYRSHIRKILVEFYLFVLIRRSMAPLLGCSV